MKEIVDDTEKEVEKSMQEEEKHEEIKKPKSMDQLIAEEIQDLKKDEKFYVFDLKMPSLIFIKISLPYKDLIDVGDLGNAIVKDIMENKKTLTRFCLRFLPIMCVWKAANNNEFNKLATREVLKYFAKQDGVRWSFEYKARGNKKIDRTEILNVSPSARIAINLYFNNFVVNSSGDLYALVILPKCIDGLQPY